MSPTPQVLEECIGHIDVVMLAGVNNLRHGPGPFFQGMVKRGDLHEIRPCGSNEMDGFLFHGCWYSVSAFVKF